MGAPGCDDAPVVDVSLGSVRKPVQMVRAYYQNPETLKAHMLGFGDLSHELRRQVSAIFVDDGSPTGQAEFVLRKLPLPVPTRLFRMDVDIRWNWLGARNVGMHHATDGWCLITDMDHFADAALLETLVYGDHDPDIIYRFSRREHTGQEAHPHPNSWFMTREMYWKIGGHDESLSGHYGTDGEYRRRCVATAPIRIMSTPLIRRERGGDSSTARYDRKQPEDRRVAKIVAARGRKWSPRILSFPYHEVVLP